MKPETDPISDDEIVLRLVWRDYFKEGDNLPVKPRAFYPRGDEHSGISVFRAACVAGPADILAALPKAENRPRYAIAALAVADLKAFGLTVVPDQIAAVPGHAVLTELNSVGWAADKVFWQSVVEGLARLASRSIIHKPAP